jgi:hypothetical protein
VRSADKAFVKFVRKTIGEHGLKLSLKKTSLLNCDSSRCYGWFDEGEICVATKNPRWIEVLAHEYSHFIQWRKGTSLYRKCFGPTNNYGEMIEDWLQGEEYDYRRVARAFETYRAMERECEKITTSVMLRHSVKFDPERYAQEANCTIYMYHFMEQRRITQFKKNPANWRVLRKMPSSFRAQSHKTIPREISDIMEDFV